MNLESPSQVRLKSGEILFVGHSDKSALLSFVDRFDVPLQRRLAVWGALLNPFIDTTFPKKRDRQGNSSGSKASASIARPSRAGDAGHHRDGRVQLRHHAVGPGGPGSRCPPCAAGVRPSGFARFHARAMTLAALDPLDQSSPATSENDRNCFVQRSHRLVSEAG